MCVHSPCRGRVVLPRLGQQYVGDQFRRDYEPLGSDRCVVGVCWFGMFGLFACSIGWWLVG